MSKEVTKFDKTVARVSGDAPPIAAPEGFGALVGASTIDELQREMVEKGWECSPMLYTIAEGTYVLGILEGEGPPAEFTDTRTGEVREVKTWILRAPDVGFRISILSSAQLDRKLPPFVGGLVKIYRGAPVKLKGSAGHVTDYLVTGPKRSAGPRSFAAPVDQAS